MFQEKSDKRKVFDKASSQIHVSVETFDPNPMSNVSESAKLTSTRNKLAASKLFGWSREKPRPGSEYVDKKFDKPFNEVAPELRVIGGFRQEKCVVKHKRQPLVNRPTQVQKLCHTTTKLLPNFPLTEQLEPVACRQKTKLSVLEAAEKVKFVENLPSTVSLDVLSETKDSFNHENPFNLDLNALSEYQKQKNYSEEAERRRNYQIIRRTMETKALKTEGIERLKQEARDEKFKLPKFFKVVKERAAETGKMMRGLI